MITYVQGIPEAFLCFGQTVIWCWYSFGEVACINFITITIFLNQQSEGFYGLGAHARSTNNRRETAKRHYNTGIYNQGNLQEMTLTFHARASRSRGGLPYETDGDARRLD